MNGYVNDNQNESNTVYNRKRKHHKNTDALRVEHVSDIVIEHDEHVMTRSSSFSNTDLASSTTDSQALTVSNSMPRSLSQVSLQSQISGKTSNIEGLPLISKNGEKPFSTGEEPRKNWKHRVKSLVRKRKKKEKTMWEKIKFWWKKLVKGKHELKTDEFNRRVNDATMEGLSKEIYQMKWKKPFVRSWFFTVIYFILSIMTLGVLPLFTIWIPSIYIYMTHQSIKDVSKATAFLIYEERAGIRTTVYVRQIMIHGNWHRYFEYRYCKYIYKADHEDFVRVKQSELFETSFTMIQEAFAKGLTREQEEIQLFTYGKNSCTIPKPNIIKLFFSEIINPFYFFQVFCMIIWAIDDYLFYAVTIGIITSVSAISALIDNVKNKNRLRSMTKFSMSIEKILQTDNNGEEIYTTSSQNLVPGDVVIIPDNGILPCDLMLLTGQVIMNESMLTGESIPIVKKSAPINSGEYFNYHTHANYILYGGTEVMQKRNIGQADCVKGLVIRSGYQCAKGELILSILYPKPNQFKFYRDSLIYIALMLLFGIVAFAGTIQFFIANKSSIGEILLRAADVFTIILPPSLPIAMTVGVTHAIYRLRKQKIFCISPPRINVSGRIDCMCFDKTGTLTENGLHLSSVIDGSDGSKVDAAEIPQILANSQLIRALACCHSLTYVNNNLIGDPLELSIFKSTKYQLIDADASDVSNVAECTIVPPQNTSNILYEDEVDGEDDMMDMKEYGILRRFEFQSALQMMSVVVRDIMEPSALFVYSKGSPEKILSLSSDSLSDEQRSSLERELTYYTQNGYRVLGCAYRRVDFVKYHQLTKMNRKQFETNLIFLGFIVLQNPIKRITPSIISNLQKNRIHCVMVTGDNALTALSVSKDCGIVAHDNRIYLSHLEKKSMSYTFDSDVSAISDSSFNALSFKNPFDLSESPVTLSDLLSLQYDDKVSLVLHGDAFAYILEVVDEDDLKNFLLSCRVFARFTPFQKMQLIEILQYYGLSVGMCGDGANDCMALKTAHIGVSLTKAEASIAAPFTSLIENISCIPDVIREGRAALATSFSTFKYMAMYSMTQTVTVILLYYVNSNLSDLQFLLIDMGIIFPIVLTMGMRTAASRLQKYRPEDTLLSIRVLLSIFLQLALVISLQVFVFFNVAQQPWFVPAEGETNKQRLRSHRSTILFIVSAFQTFFIGQSFNISFPFRRWLIFQPLTLLVSFLLFVTLLYLALYPCSFLMYWFEFASGIPLSYKLWILLYCTVFGIASYGLEFIVIHLLLRFPVPSLKKLYRKPYHFVRP